MEIDGNSLPFLENIKNSILFSFIDFVRSSMSHNVCQSVSVCMSFFLSVCLFGTSLSQISPSSLSCHMSLSIVRRTDGDKNTLSCFI